MAPAALGEHRVLTGEVAGPRSRYASTLAARVPLRMVRGAGGASPAETAALAEAVVPDPCCWTPEQPFLYRVKVELHCDGRPAAAAEFEIGFRPLGVANGALRYAGKPYRLMGCRREAAPDASWGAWRESGLALLTPLPDDAVCRAASEVGVWLIAELPSHVDVSAELARLQRWPSVAMAIAPDRGAPAPRVRNLVVAQRDPGAAAAASPHRLAATTIDFDAPLYSLSAGGLFVAAAAATGVGLPGARDRCLAFARRLEYAGIHEYSGILA